LNLIEWNRRRRNWSYSSLFLLKTGATVRHNTFAWFLEGNVKKLRVCAIASLLMLFTSMGARASNIVVNGGFETGDFTGWLFTPGPEPETLVAAYHVPHSGSWDAEFGALACCDGISQNLPTTPGQSYTISFWLATWGPNAGEFDAYWDGTQLLGGQPFAGQLNTGRYQQFTYVETATGASTALTFAGYSPPDFYDLDDVSVTARMPEPSSWLLVAGGVLLAAASRFRRRTFIRKAIE
jgi:hypothetical protein